MRVYVDLIVSGMYLVQVSLLLIGDQVCDTSDRPLLPIGWMTVQIVCQRQRKITNTAPTTLGTIQTASQSTFIKAHIILLL